MLHRSSYFYHVMLDNEILIRIGAFSVWLSVLLFWEYLSPRRKTLPHHWLRRINNLALIFVSILIIQVLLPVLALLGITAMAADQSLGLFNTVNLPYWLEFMVSIIILDLAIYGQHRLFHKYEILWRLHRVHHCDSEFDVTTGFRFHPGELIISLGIKSVVVVILGAPALAVLTFELLLNLLPMFNHGNIRLPESIDRCLRLVVVTPDMHRVHHSKIRQETNSNYCFCLSWWDRLFNTYRSQPGQGHENMKIGLEEFSGSDTIHLHNLLLLPFRRTPA